MKRLFILLVLLLVMLCGCTSKHYDENNINELYNSEWIVGKSKAEIVKKYGDFDREYDTLNGKNQAAGAYYVNYDNISFILPPSYNHDTYFIYFDENDIATESYFAESSRGG